MIAIEASGPDRLTIRYDDTVWPRCCLGGALLLAFLAGVTWGRNGAMTERLAGCVGGMLVLGLGFLAGYEKSTFVFDRDRGTVVWERVRVYGRRRGDLRLASIRGVLAERPIGDRGLPDARLVLQTESGPLPIATAFAPDVGGRTRAVAAQLRSFLGLAG